MGAGMAVEDEEEVAVVTSEVTGEVTLDALPDELLVAVFSWLPPWLLAGAVSEVCQRWRRLSRDRALWTGARLDCADQGCTQEAALRTLVCAPGLHSLSAGDPYRAPSAALLRAVVACSTPISALHLLSVECDADLVLSVVRRLAPCLQEVALRVDRKLASRGAVDADLDQLGEPSALLAALAGMPMLGSLRLLGNAPRGACEGWARLERLDIRQAVLDRDVADSFLVALLRCCAHRLRALLLPRYTPLAPVVFSQLTHCRQLSHFAPPRLEDLVIADALPSLTELLVECDLFDAKKHEFVGRLPGLRRVRALSLRVGDEEGAVFLARACPCTRELTLRGTLSAWAPRIAAGLPDVRRLRVVEPPVRLRLGTADPLRVRAGFLVDTVRALPRLEILHLKECFQRRALPDDVLAELRRSYPGLRVMAPPRTGDHRSPEDDSSGDEGG